MIFAIYDEGNHGFGLINLPENIGIGRKTSFQNYPYRTGTGPAAFDSARGDSFTLASYPSDKGDGLYTVDGSLDRSGSDGLTSPYGRTLARGTWTWDGSGPISSGTMDHHWSAGSFPDSSGNLGALLFRGDNVVALLIFDTADDRESYFALFGDPITDRLATWVADTATPMGSLTLASGGGAAGDGAADRPKKTA